MLGGVIVEQLQSAVPPLVGLPWQSWALLFLSAIATYIVWALAAWVGSLLERGRFLPTNYVAKKSWNNFVMLSTGDWPEGAEHKKSDLLVRYLGPDGLKSARGKIFRTAAAEFSKGTVGLPQLMRDDLGLTFDTVMQPCALEITVVRPLPIVGLWRHPEDSIRISTRTTFWVTLFTTITGILTSWVLR